MSQPPPRAPTPQPPPPSWLDRLRSKRWARALGAFAFVVAFVPSVADFPYVTRWQGWAALLVLATACTTYAYARRLRVVVVATAVALAATPLLLILGPNLTGHDTARGTVRRAGAPHMIRAATDDDPQAITVALGYAWVVHADGTLLAFDAQGVERLRFMTRPGATDIAACGGALSIAYGDGWVGRFDPATGRRLSHYHFGSRSDRVLCGGRDVWTDKLDRGSVVDMRARTLELRYELPIGSGLSSMTYGDRALWAADTSARRIVGIDVRTRELIAQVSTMEDPTLAVFADDRVWVVHTLQSCLMRIDLARKLETGPGIPLGPAPKAAVASDGILYVVDYDDATLRQIDAATGAPVMPTVRLGRGRRLVGVAAHAGRVYVLDSAHDQLLILRPLVLDRLARTARVSTQRSRLCPAEGTY